MNGIACLESYLLPLSRRTPPEPLFYRVVGRDERGMVLSFVKKLNDMAARDGACLTVLNNPSEPEIERFYAAVGDSFALSVPLITRHMTVWLGQLRPSQRDVLARAVDRTLGLLREKGANENIVKNAYVKFMCWFRAAFGRALSGLGRDVPPKVVYTGDVGKYPALALYLMYCAGCDVLYVNYVSEDSYRKADPDSQYSLPLIFALRTPPEPEPAPAPVRGTSGAQPPADGRNRTASAPAWKGLEDEVELNAWAAGRTPWEAVLDSCAERRKDGPRKMRCLFAACLGADERAAYRNRLYSLRRALASRKFLLFDSNVPAPAAAETQAFRAADRTAPPDVMLRSLCDGIAAPGRVPTLLAQRAFTMAMERNPSRDPVRIYNHGVRLACWLNRCLSVLYEDYRAEFQPAVLYYGPAREAEITLLWTLAQCGVDVLYFCPDRAALDEFTRHYLPHDWREILFDGSLALEPFPQREERLQASTTAYNASRELDKLLYTDTGMFRDRQFTRSSPVTLRTTVDEVGQLWKEEAQFRPSFRAENGTVYVPNLFAKVCGVDKGDPAQYWDRLRDMVTEDTYLVTALPFLRPAGQPMRPHDAEGFLHDGKLDPRALKASPFYRYDHLPDDTQDYILEKIQALIDYDLIVDGGPGLPAAMLSVLTNLDKELLRLLQNFDFTRRIPKFLAIDATESMFTLEECILIAFLNLVGFDIAVFTPTGYRNLEKHLRPDSFQTLTAGEYMFELPVPDLRRRKNASGAWLGRIFGGR